MRRTGTIRPVLLLLSLAAGCDDPAVPLLAPEQQRLLGVYMVLDPDSTPQTLLIETLDVGGEFEGFVRAEVYSGAGALVAADTQASVPDLPEIAEIIDPCARRYGSIGANSPHTCLRLDFQPEHGTDYRVLVTAEGRPAAEAATRVPGDFEILSVAAHGSPPGTEGLEVRWTVSEGAYRYVVALRSEQFECYDVHGCLGGWFAETDTTALRATVPEDRLEEGSGPWHIDVYALDRALYEYLTTGSGGELFAIPPVGNVDGGHGIVGAWVHVSEGVP